MADRPVGAAKIVLSLDPTNLEKQLVGINTKLVDGMASIDAAYKALGTKSGPAFEAMKANAVAAMNAITASGKQSNEELVRIQQAAALKIQNITEQQYKAQEAARAKFQTSSAAYWTAEMKFEAEARAKMQAESAAYWTSKMRLEADARAKMQASSAAYWTAEMKFEAEARAKANAANAEYWLTKKKFEADAKKEAESASKAPWQTLGIQSVAAINQQKEAVKAAYMEITKSADLSHRDIVNLERAKNDKLKALNREMVGGHQMSMAAMMRAVLRFYAAWYVASTAVSVVAAPFEKGFKAVEAFNTSVAESAAMVMSFSEKAAGMSVADQWKNALSYSRQLVPILEQIAARTLLSGQETVALSNAFQRQGVFLNAQNKDQIEGFTRIANALPLMTQGSEIMRQINTEIGSLMKGTNASTSALLTSLREMDPNLDSNLKKWRETNSVLTEIGKLLVGFGYATSLLETEWQAVKSTLDTTVTKILREGMLGAYPEIIKKTQELNDYLEKNGEHLSKIFGNVASVMASAAGYIVDLFIAADKVLTLASKLSGFQNESFSAYSDRMFKDAFSDESTALVSAHGNALKMAAAHGKDYVQSIKGAYKDPEALKYLKSLEQEISLIGLTEAAKEKLQAREKGLRGEQLKTAEALIDQKHARLDNEEAEKDLAKFEEDRLKKISEANRKAGEASQKKYKQEEKSITDYIDKLQLEIDTIGISDQAKERLEAREKGLTGERLKSVDAMIAQKYTSTAAWKAAEEANAAIEADDKKRSANVDTILDGLRAEAAQLKLTAREQVIYNLAKEGVTSGPKFEAALKEFDAITAAKKEVEDFKNSVSGLFETMQAGVDTGQSFGDSLSEGINNAVVSMQSLTKMYEGLNAAQQLSADLASGKKFDNDPEKDAEARKKAVKDLAEYEAQSTANQLSAYRQLFGTTSQLFKENSRERKAMSAIEQGLAAIEIALNMKKALANAVTAVSAQGSVPIAGFAMVAAMAALMAGVLSQAGVSFSGGSSSAVTAKPTATNYSGTVLGDITKSSESITNVTDLMESIHADEYPELQGIRREMVELNNNITGLVSSIVQNGGTFDGSTTSTQSSFVTANEGYLADINKTLMSGNKIVDTIVLATSIGLPALVKLVSSVYSYVGSALFGGGSKTWTTGAGLELGSASIGSLVSDAGEGMDVSTYADYRTKKSGGWFGKTKWSNSSVTSEADEDIQRLFTTVFSGLSDSIISIGDSLFGDSLEPTFEKIKSYVWDIGKIDLMNLTGEEINAKLEAVISTAADTAAGALFEGIKQYQQVGEGLYETAARLVVDKEVVLQSLKAVGMAFEGAANSMDAVAFSEALLTIAGDLETFTENVSSYFTAFFSEAEQTSWSVSQLSASLLNLGKALPATRDGFRDLVEEQDLLTPAGQSAFVALMSLADAADAVYDASEKAAKELISISDWVDSLRSKWEPTNNLDIIGERYGLTRDQMLNKDALTEAYNAFQADPQAVKDVADKFHVSVEQVESDMETLIDAVLAVGEASTLGARLLALRSKWEPTNDMEMLGARYGKSQSDLLDEKAVGSAYLGFLSNPDSLKDVATQLGISTDQVIADLGTVVDAIIALHEAAKGFSTFKMSLTGMSGTDLTLNTLGQKYNWGSGFGSTGNWDYAELYNTGIKPILEMTFEEFNALAGSLGMTWSELETDTSSLASVFNDLSDEAKAARDTFKDLSDSLRDQILDMKTSTDNQADVYERLGIQKGAISDVLGGQSIGGYLGGLGSDSEKASAIQKLQDLFGGELTLAQEAYERPSLVYQGEYSTVLGGLESLLEYSDLMKSEYQLQYEQTDYLKMIAENTAGLVEIPKYADGGFTPSGGLAILHPNELILNQDQQQALRVPVTTQNDSGATVYITVNAYGGDSKEVAKEVISKVKAEFPSWTKSGPVRFSISEVSKGR